MSCLMEFWILICLFIFVQTVAAFQSDEGKCVLYGQCAHDTLTKLKLPCLYDGPPIALNDTSGLETLAELCPIMALDNENRTCCSAPQVADFKGQINRMGTLFKRCPSCYQNLANVFCHLVCSPKQSQYLQVLKSNETDEGKAYIQELAYYMTEDYAQGLFNSCVNVRMSYTTTTAMTISCGGFGSNCNVHNWLYYMGGHDPSPFKIDFQFFETDHILVNDTGFFPMNETIYKCNEVPHKGSVSCSCVDCPCTPVPLPPVPEPFRIGKWNGIWVIMAIMFGLATLAIITGFIAKNLTSNVQEDTMNLLDSDEISRINNTSSCSKLEHIGELLDLKLQQFFCAWGKWCATYPLTVIFISLCFLFICSCGFIFFFTVRTNPVELWSSPDSVVRKEKDYFDSHFGPFYRTEQIIIRRNNGTPVLGQNETYSDVFDRAYLHEILALQRQITSLTAERNNRTIRFEDICFDPLSNGKCMIQSIVNWFQNSDEHLDYYKDTDEYLNFIHNCTLNEVFVQKEGLSCLGEYGGPVFPYVALGGVQDGNYNNATALIITLMVNNHVNDEDNADAMAWELKYLDFIKKFKHPDMTISYSSERSIQDELNRESESDITTILISYLVMFAYVSITLGQYSSTGLLFVKSKLLLGLGGVSIALISVVTSIGIFSFFGVPSTLIIIEVIPFLVLAVGVDNIFIIVQSYYRTPRHELETREEHIGRVIGKIAPSLLLASLSESTCFFLGALSDMPAVNVFALFSGMALLIDFLLQVTCFVALLSLDLKREESLRMEFCCCVKATPPETPIAKTEGFLYKLFDSYYSIFLMKDYIRAFVLVIFTGWLCTSIAVLSQIEVGLDQKLSMPEDSYVLDYFKGLEEYLSVGPPVYFVVKSGFNYSNVHDQNVLCSGAYCIRESLAVQLSDASTFSNRTYIAHAPMNWLDNYISWVNDETDCCRVYAGSTKFCPNTEKELQCTECGVTDTVMFRPLPDKFYNYFDDFLEENPDADCPAAGHAAFASSLQMMNTTSNGTLRIGASNFMTYHSILKTSEDYISALKSARDIAGNITKSFHLYGISDENAEVFPYSIFYVFYEQYLTVWKDTIKNISVSLVDIFIVTLLLMGLDFHSSFILVLTILMITLNLMGLMFWWEVSLNAVSLVNLVMSVGISVEFCSHITRAFALRPHGNRVQRAQYALAHMGSSVLSGITLTKFGGIIVLAFSKSQIFRVFYFRMYLGIVLIGASHGLIFLPVLLSVLGPPVRKGNQKHEYTKAQKSEKMTESAATMSGSQSYQQNIDDNHHRRM